MRVTKSHVRALPGQAPSPYRTHSVDGLVGETAGLDYLEKTNNFLDFAGNKATIPVMSSP
jgi:hypothetical protein